MAGKAGTPRFGINPDSHAPGDRKSGPNGITHDTLPDGTNLREVHYAYNPAFHSRDVDQAPARCYVEEDRQPEYMSNHDGYVGGNVHNIEMDERKVLDNTINSVKVKYEADQQKISGTTGMFD